MAIEYKCVKISTPVKKTGEDYKYYPRISNRKKIDLHDMAKRISDMSTFSGTDVVGVLEAFVSEIPSFLLDNCSVELGDLGTFSLHLSSEGFDRAEQVNPHRIKDIKMAFRPGTRVKRSLKEATFRKIRE